MASSRQSRWAILGTHARCLTASTSPGAPGVPAELRSDVGVYLAPLTTPFPSSSKRLPPIVDSEPLFLFGAMLARLGVAERRVDVVGGAVRPVTHRVDAGRGSRAFDAVRGRPAFRPVEDDALATVAGGAGNLSRRPAARDARPARPHAACLTFPMFHRSKVPKLIADLRSAGTLEPLGTGLMDGTTCRCRPSPLRDQEPSQDHRRSG